MFHHLEIEGRVNLPRQFTFPFCYTPHPLAIMAAEETKKQILKKIAENIQWANDLKEGKMFGVLVVQNQEGELGFLSAFSGQIDNRYDDEYFVPAVYDLNRPDGFFREEEKNITEINNRIESLEKESVYLHNQNILEERREELNRLRNLWKERLTEAKRKRDERREMGVTQDEEKEMIRESQFLKAEYHRVIKKAEESVKEISKRIEQHQGEIEELCQERKRKSIFLQQRLFSSYKFRNAKGEECSLLTIFREYPPSGAGECAAPKLLQYAYQKEMKPLCMAEFWWGKSPKSIIRKHGNYYPACMSKCKPILDFMLEGLDVESNPMERKQEKEVKIIYEDDYLCIVDKPEERLSTPGLLQTKSVEQEMRERLDDPRIKAVHRLDYDTSGILMLAKDESTYVTMQKMFAQRRVKKQYLAILDGECGKSGDKGVIMLPLCEDWDNRPCQKVDKEKGKFAETAYEIVKVLDGKTMVKFYPQTGKTHQLRIHSAHCEGLNCPILGDTLYGKGKNETIKRLHLQAQKITFEHPITGTQMTIELKPYLYLCNDKKE